MLKQNGKFCKKKIKEGLKEYQEFWHKNTYNGCYQIDIDGVSEDYVFEEKTWRRYITIENIKSKGFSWQFNSLSNFARKVDKELIYVFRNVKKRSDLNLIFEIENEKVYYVSNNHKLIKEYENALYLNAVSFSKKSEFLFGVITPESTYKEIEFYEKHNLEYHFLEKQGNKIFWDQKEMELEDWRKHILLLYP